MRAPAFLTPERRSRDEAADDDKTREPVPILVAAKSPIEAFDVSAKYWRGRLETRIAQAQDLGAFVRKTADDVVRPVQERIEKFTKIAA